MTQHTPLQHSILRSIPADKAIRATEVLGWSQDRYFAERAYALQTLIDDGLVVVTWDTVGHTYVQRTVI